MSRYIDADAIQYDEDIPDIYTVSKTRIDNMPSADVRENVRGEWIRCKMARMDKDESIIYYRNWKCNVCGYASNEEYDYCPYCGARMR